MVQAAARLEELFIYCPFSTAHLPRWLAARIASLRVLELRVDSAAAGSGSGPGHLDCIALVPNLEELRLWGLTMRSRPTWGQLQDPAWCPASSRSSLVLLGVVGTGKSRLVVCFVKVQFVEFQPQESTIGATFFSQTLAIRSSSKSGTRPARRGTTAWYPCTSPTRCSGWRRRRWSTGSSFSTVQTI